MDEVGCMPLWPWQSQLGCRQTTDGADDERRCETLSFGKLERWSGHGFTGVLGGPVVTTTPLGLEKRPVGLYYTVVGNPLHVVVPRKFLQDRYSNRGLGTYKVYR